MTKQKYNVNYYEGKKKAKSIPAEGAKERDNVIKHLKQKAESEGYCRITHSKAK